MYPLKPVGTVAWAKGEEYVTVGKKSKQAQCSKVSASRLSMVLQSIACPAYGTGAAQMLALKRWWLSTSLPPCSRTSGHWWQHGRGVAVGPGPPCQAEQRTQHWVDEVSGQYLASIFTCWSHICLTLRHPALWINLTQSHLFINNTEAV